MSTSNARYLPRAPRYRFQSGDQSYVRFAPLRLRRETMIAAIQDLSETGLAFLVSNEVNVEEGEILKLEFTLPGHEQLACFGTVVRIDEITQADPEWGARKCWIVGIQFRHLTRNHITAIRRGLERRLDTASENDWRELRSTHTWGFIGFSVAMIISLAILATPITSWLWLFQFQ